MRTWGNTTFPLGGRTVRTAYPHVVIYHSSSATDFIVLEWLNSHDIDFRWDMEPEGVNMCFADPDAAMLFKLTWT